MNGIDAIAAIGAQATLAAPAATAAPCADAQHAGAISFGELLTESIEHVETRVDHANEMVRAFTLDDSVPVHEVTIALEEARIAVELAMQVRTRIVEGYREIMNMQL